MKLNSKIKNNLKQDPKFNWGKKFYIQKNKDKKIGVKKILSPKFGLEKIRWKKLFKKICSPKN